MKSPSRCSRLDWCSMVATRWTPFARGAWVSDTSGNQNAFPGSVRWSQPGRPNLASCAPTRLEFSEPARVTNSPPGCAALNGLSVQPAQSLLLWGRPPTKRTMDNGQGLGRRHSHRENPIGATTVVVNKDESHVPGCGSCVRGMGAKLRPLLPAGAGVCAVGRQMVGKIAKTAPCGAVSE